MENFDDFRRIILKSTPQNSSSSTRPNFFIFTIVARYLFAPSVHFNFFATLESLCLHHPYLYGTFFSSGSANGPSRLFKILSYKNLIDIDRGLHSFIPTQANSDRTSRSFCWILGDFFWSGSLSDLQRPQTLNIAFWTNENIILTTWSICWVDLHDHHPPNKSSRSVVQLQQQGQTGQYYRGGELVQSSSSCLGAALLP